MRETHKTLDIDVLFTFYQIILVSNSKRISIHPNRFLNNCENDAFSRKQKTKAKKKT